MTTKDIALQTIERLPNTATWADIEERVRFLAAIDRGLDDIRAGRVIPHADVKRNVLHVLRIWHASRGVPEID